MSFTNVTSIQFQKHITSIQHLSETLFLGWKAVQIISINMSMVGINSA